MAFETCPSALITSRFEVWIARCGIVSTYFNSWRHILFHLLALLLAYSLENPNEIRKASRAIVLDEEDEARADDERVEEIEPELGEDWDQDTPPDPPMTTKEQEVKNGNEFED